MIILEFLKYYDNFKLLLVKNLISYCRILENITKSKNEGLRHWTEKTSRVTTKIYVFYSDRFIVDTEK